MARFRIALALCASSVMLAACGGASTNQTVPAIAAPTTQSVSRSVQDEDRHDRDDNVSPVADPTALLFPFVDIASGTTQSFTVTQQSKGDLTAVSSNTAVATVSPASTCDSDKKHHHKKHHGWGFWRHGDGDEDCDAGSQTFTVTPLATGTTTITITDHKGLTATVTVRVFGIPTA